MTSMTTRAHESAGADEALVRSHGPELALLAAEHGISDLRFASTGRLIGHVADDRDMFDVAALWQAGFRQSTCGWGTHLNRMQYEQLARGERTIWIVFDGDAAGHKAAHELAQRLHSDGCSALRVILPKGHDPASYFAAGADSTDFHRLLTEARP